ncbi:MAG: leucine-rich repeat domain-containing protein [Lewinellaceae bacterium]|nr:leucine-rich repeat domain-containing protein [Lewinellaceae bacterium]
MDCYQQLIEQGNRYQNRKAYEDAIRFYLAALSCPDRPPEEDKLPALIEKALQARVEQVEEARRQVEAEKLNTQVALDKANKLIDAFYFYDGRFALALGGKNSDPKFYFIDKNGDKVKKLGEWDSAEQFEYTGFARVKKKDQLYLIDTAGLEYPLATEVEQLAEGITALDLRNRKLDSIPPAIFKHQSLKVLLLSENQISELPAQIGQLANLTSLNLYYNQLSELPAQIGQLDNLTSLDLSFNQLSDLPPQIGQLANLTELSLYNNQLSELPAQIGQLTNLTELSLSLNQLSELPPQIGQLDNLTSLDLFDNQLSKLPAQIGQLTNLTKLSLYNNQLNELPAQIGKN